MTKHLPKAFGGLINGTKAFQREMAKAGFDFDDYHLRIPPPLGQVIEDELLDMPVEMWAPYTYGIEIHADGHLKQMVLWDSIRVGWRTHRTEDTDVKSHSKAGNRSQIRPRNTQ